MIRWLPLATAFSLLGYIGTVYTQNAPTPLWPQDLIPLARLSDVSGTSMFQEPNAVHLQHIATWGRGIAWNIRWSTTTDEILVGNSYGIWAYDPANITAPPRHIDIPATGFSSSTDMAYRLNDDNTVEGFDLLTGERRFQVTFPLTESYRFLTLTPDGNRIISGRHAWDTPFQAFEVWDIAEQRLIPLEKPYAFNEMPLFTSDGHTMIALDSDIIRVWDLTSGAVLAEYRSQISETWESANIFLSPNNHTVILTREGDTLELWDIERGLRVTVAHPHTARIMNVTFSPDGATMLTHDANGLGVVWDNRRNILGQFTLDSNYSALDIRLGGEQMVSVDRDHRLQLFHLPDGTLLAETPPYAPNRPSVGYGGLMTLQQSGVYEWDVATGQIIRATPVDVPFVSAERLSFPVSNVFITATLGADYQGNAYLVPKWFQEQPNDTHLLTLPAEHTPGSNVRYFAPVAISQQAFEGFGEAMRQRWLLDTFASVDDANRIVFWSVSSNYPDDDVTAAAQVHFRPLLTRQLFSETHITIHDISTYDRYLAVGTSDGLYVWDIIEMIRDESTAAMIHERDAFQPDVYRVVWLAGLPSYNDYQVTHERDMRMAYTGNNGVVTILDVRDPSYRAQLNTDLAQVTALTAQESLLVVAGCTENSLYRHAVDQQFTLICERYGFNVFTVNYDEADQSVLLASPELMRDHNRDTAIEGIFFDENVIGFDINDGTVEFWGVPTPAEQE